MQDIHLFVFEVGKKRNLNAFEIEILKSIIQNSQKLYKKINKKRVHNVR